MGLIAGNGRFPILFSDAARKRGVFVVAVALKEEADPTLEKSVDKLYWISIGELKSVIDIFKSEKIKKAVMAGRITKTRLFKDTPKLDSTTRGLLSKVADKNDMSLLKKAASVLKFFGITMMDSTMFMEDYMPDRGVLSEREPTADEWTDIKFGFSLAKKTSGLDIGQTVVVKSKAILAIEAIEGTDEAILRGGKLGNGDVVVVKVARPRQDKRFDIPTIGPETLRSLERAGGRVLAIEAKKMFLIDRQECLELVNKNNFSLVVL